MKQVFNSLFIAVCLLVAAPRAQAQLFVDTTYTAEQMVNDFFNIMGDCVTATNITHTGALNGMAFFEGSASNVGLNAGIMLSSGSAALATDTAGATFFASSASEALGDAQLDLQLGSGYITYDASVIEFDIVSTDPDLNFVYVFGSEEYPEFVGSSFNDIFGFFISGPGFAEPQNIALVPGTAIPVAINNVNNITNSSFYIANDSIPVPNAITYDGFTIPLTATATVIPGETYHIKLAIADAGDSIFDSGVFIGIESLCGGGIIPLAPEFDAEVSGMSASFQNFTNYATYWHWDFGDGTNSVARYPTHTYAENGIYTVTLQSGNFSGEATHTETVTIGSVGTGNVIAPKPYTLQQNLGSELDLQTESPAQINLFDLNGRLLYRQNATTHSNINLQPYGKGMFVLQIIAKGQAYSEKVVF